MIKRDWSSVEASTDIEYKKLTAGGYICKIVEVEDCPRGFNPSAPEKGDYLKINIDIAEGDFTGYFAQSAEKFGNWPNGGIYYASYTEKAAGMFKRLINALEDSNKRFVWNDKISENPKLIEGLEIGVVFREEEYIGRDGNVKSNLKPYLLYCVDAIEDGNYKVPDKKAAQKKQDVTFVELDSDGDLPF